MNDTKCEAKPARAPASARRTGADARASRRAAGAGRRAAAAQATAAVVPPSLPTSLAFALETAATVVGAVRAGAALPAALATSFASRAASLHEGDASDANTANAMADAASDARTVNAAPGATRGDWHGATQDIAYRTLRTLALVDGLIAIQVAKPPPPPVRDLLACALALLAATDAPYPAHTVVDQAVRASATTAQTAFARGLVNAVLRRFLRERDALLEQVRRDPVAQWNYPRWWIEAVQRAWPTRWQAVLAAGNVQAPMTLRINRRQTTPAAYLDTLQAAGLAADLAPPCGVRLRRAVSVDRLPGFASGRVSVQDAGAQQAALLLDVADGMRVLDACAAPGGKTGHLLELADIELVALESDPVRARRIGDNLRRLGLRAEVKVGDAGHPAALWWDDRPFDRVLADVPCSASGIVRRHPDIRWLRRPEDIRALVTAQRRILDALWQVVAPEGILLYVTCSIFPEEGEEQARWFERSREDAVRLEAPGQLAPTLAPTIVSGAAGVGPDHDGFFYARFQKR